MTQKWKPMQDCITKARVARGIYLCAGCNQEVPATIRNEESGKRVKNIIADHIVPVVDPAVGFTTWDDFIERLLCEEDNLQALCHACHQAKCREEIDVAVARRKREKEENT